MRNVPSWRSKLTNGRMVLKLLENDCKVVDAQKVYTMMYTRNTDLRLKSPISIPLVCSRMYSKTMIRGTVRM